MTFDTRKVNPSRIKKQSLNLRENKNFHYSSKNLLFQTYQHSFPHSNQIARDNIYQNYTKLIFKRCTKYTTNAFLSPEINPKSSGILETFDK